MNLLYIQNVMIQNLRDEKSHLLALSASYITVQPVAVDSKECVIGLLIYDQLATR